MSCETLNSSNLTQLSELSVLFQLHDLAAVVQGTFYWCSDRSKLSVDECKYVALHYLSQDVTVYNVTIVSQNSQLVDCHIFTLM